MTTVLLEARSVTLDRPPPTGRVLEGVDLTVNRREIVVVTGPSGSGKTTLLHFLGLLLRPTSGTYRIHGTDVGGLSDRAAARLRARTFGFAYQDPHLIGELTVLDNLLIVLDHGDAVPRRAATERAVGLLSRVGLEPAAGTPARQLSGGEQQRVGLARALIRDPPVILADEPTSALDDTNAGLIRDLLVGLTVDGRRALVLATHDPGAVLTHATSRVHLSGGRVATESLR